MKVKLKENKMGLQIIRLL